MALGATVYKATIDVSDLDRDSYGNYVLTIARHPSETEERLMLRVLAFCRLEGAGDGDVHGRFRGEIRQTTEGNGESGPHVSGEKRLRFVSPWHFCAFGSGRALLLGVQERKPGTYPGRILKRLPASPISVSPSG